MEKVPLHSDDVIWTAGWLIKLIDENFLHSNWNGWMTKYIHLSQTKLVALSIIQLLMEILMITALSKYCEHLDFI